MEAIKNPNPNDDLPETKPFRPSNGDMGSMFEYSQCRKCQFSDDCDVFFRSVAYDIDDETYPTEFVSDLDGSNPRCTARVEIEE